MALDFPSSPTNGQTFVSGTRTWTYNTTTSSWESTSPVTVSQTANYVYAAPNGSAGAPNFRALVAADIPTLNQNTTGTAATITGVYSGTITSAQITTGLGFTPYNATNPSGYTSNLGTVTGVTGTAPIVSSGGTAPAISISAATTAAAGSMSATDKTKLDGIATSANNYVLPKATASALGGVEVFDATVQTVAANAVTSTASRTYGVQLNAADQMVVNVPWVDTTNTGTVTSVATGTGLTGGPVTSTGTISLANTTVTAGSYTNSNITVDAQGRITAASNGAGTPTFDGLTAKTGGTGTYQTSGDFRAPIFYDSNNTSFYLDPNGSSLLANLTTTGRQTNAAGVKTYSITTVGQGNSNTTYEIMRISRDSANWSTNIPYEVTVYSAYYSSGGSTRWSITYGYNDTGTISCIDARGGTKHRVYLGTPVVVTGNISYIPVYVDIPNYYGVSIEIKYTTTEVSSFNNASQVMFTGTYAAGTGGLYSGDTHLVPNGGKVGIGTTNPTEELEAFGTDASIVVHNSGQSRGGIAALSGARIALTTTTSGDDLVFGYAGSPITSAGFVPRMTIDNGTGSITGSTDFRAPIFYDSDNTARYVDPNSTSQIGSTYVNGYFQVQYNSGNQFAGIGIRNNYGSASAQSTTFLDFINENGIQKASVFARIATDGAGYLEFLSTAAGVSRSTDSRTTTAYAYSNQWSFQTSAGISANIVYDRDDTTYYFDGASTSRLNQARFQNRISVGDGSGTPFLNGGSPGVWLSFNGGSDIFMGSENSTSAGFYLGSWRFRVNSSGSATASADFRAPIFYDSDNTSYYIDPNSLSNLVTIYATKGGANNTAAIQIRGGHPGYPRLQTYGLDADANAWMGLGTDMAGGPYEHSVYFSTGTSNNGRLSIGDYNGTTYNPRLWVYTSYTQINNSTRSPLFYDSDDTGYYTDPASTSNLNGLTVAGTITGSITGTAGKATDLAQARYVNNNFNTLGTTGQVFRAYTNYIPSGGSYNQPLAGGQDFKVIQWGDIDGGTSGNWGGQIVQNFYSDRMWFRRSYGTTWEAWREFIHDGNVSSFAMPTGASATNTVDVRAPIFYDNADTSFYLDLRSNPVSPTISLNMNGDIRSKRYSHPNGIAWDTEFFLGETSNSDVNGSFPTYITGYGLNIRKNSDGAFFGLVTYDGGTNYHTVIGWGDDTSEELQFRFNNVNQLRLTGGGSLIATTSMQAPVFYNSADTGYYWDPGASSAHRLQTPSGYLDLGPMNASFCHFQTDRPQFYFGQNIHADGVYYDYDNTGYYVDPASTSIMNQIYYAGLYNASDTNYGIVGNNGFFDTLNSGVAGDQLELCYSRGTFTSTSGSMRAPIFYDRDDTSVRWDGGTLVLRNASPTVYFRDTDHNSAMVHVNSNIFYVLRGGNDTETWTTVGSGSWPLEINLTNNNAQFGGIVTAITDMRAPVFYDSNDTNYYVNPAGSSVLYSVEMINQRCSFSRQWDNYPGISVYNTTDQGPQGDFRIFGSVGANGGDFSVRLLVDGNVQSLVDVVAGGALRAPIYYDTDNTGYYDNPAGTSNLYRIYANDKFYARGNVGVDECCGSDATISVGGSSTRPPSISWHYSGVMQGNMQANQTGWRKVYFYDDQGSGLGIHATGQIASNADVIAYYSDKRLKKDLVRVVDHWNVINNLNGYRFTWNEKSGEIPGFQDKVGKREVGLIAQDVQAVYPEAIAMRTEGPEEDPYMTIKHDRFTAVFIEALKDLRRELDEVKEENKKLREMINGQ